MKTEIIKLEENIDDIDRKFWFAVVKFEGIPSHLKLGDCEVIQSG